MEAVKLPARSPNLNSYAERFVRAVKSECLAKIIRPVKLSKMDRVTPAADELMDAHDETFRKLAK